MAAHKIWSEEKKQYIRSLLPRKKILFANINSNTKAYWKDDNIDHDIIMGYYPAHDVYIACEAKFHRGKKSASFNCVAEHLRSRIIKIGYRKRADIQTLKEKVIIIPYSELENFCRYADYYLERYDTDKK